MIFGKTDDPKVARRLSKLRRAFPSHSRKKFTRHLKQFNPDAVLCTHYSPLETLGLLRAKGARRWEPDHDGAKLSKCCSSQSRPSEIIRSSSAS